MSYFNIISPIDITLNVHISEYIHYIGRYTVSEEVLANVMRKYEGTITSFGTRYQRSIDGSK